MGVLSQKKNVERSQTDLFLLEIPDPAIPGTIPGDNPFRGGFGRNGNLTMAAPKSRQH